MNASELQSIIAKAKDIRKRSFFVNRSLFDGLNTEIKKLEMNIQDVMGKSYQKLTESDKIPEDIKNGADFLTSCHGAWKLNYFPVLGLSLLI